MNKKGYPLILALAWLIGPHRAAAQGTAITYQGQLNDGAAAATGSYDVTFTLFDAATAGQVVAGPITNSAVTVSNGVFTTTVDFGSVFSGTAYWLELGVNTNASTTAFQVLSPRQAITPVPYAIYSANAGHAASADQATGLAGGVSAIQLNTLAAPTAGQVLGYDGTQLAWQPPAVGGTTGGWALTGNLGTSPGADFLGTLDNQPLEFKVGGVRGLRLEPNSSGYPNVVGGAPSNMVSNGVVGAVIGGGIFNIAGGQQSFVGGGWGNKASGPNAIVVGGLDNTASGWYSFLGGGSYITDSGASLGNTASGDWSTLVGGDSNESTAYAAAVGGGVNNIASGSWSTVPGGALNVASGISSLAAGYHAHAATPGSFVWGDYASTSDFTSIANNQFLIRANGGVGINTAQTPPNGLRVDGGGLAVTGTSSPHYPGAAGVFVEKYSTTTGAIYAYDYNANAPLPLALNSPGGYVGIGTLSPAYELDVNGTTRTHSLIITGGADLAEPFRMGGEVIPQGAVVVIDEEHPGQLKMSASAYDRHVAGIVSGANGIHPGIALQQAGALEGGQNVALSGRVYVLADATSGAIRPGDLLTTSQTPGHAMKVTRHAKAQGAILGKAMTGLSNGRGMVLVLVTLQ